ncbi:MAG: hypothetical protein VX346_19315 [Planctomycetota bacterium]|nr:hypothetical protein [Planctomycetota bacterium]
MKRVACFLVVILGLAAVATAGDDTDTTAQANFVKPGSWEAFVAYHEQGGDFGSWISKGKTIKLWEGIPAGLDYTLSFTISLAHQGQAMIQTHHMATSTGEVISTGTILRYWDERSKSVLSSHSGFDQGQLYTGHSELVGIDASTQTTKWKYTETSRGKTADFFLTVQRKGPNKRSEVHQLASGGEPWNYDVVREMALMAARRPPADPGLGRRTLQRLRGLLRRLR